MFYTRFEVLCLSLSVPRGILKRAIHLLGIYRKCSVNRHEDKKVLHRRSYIELGHILHARARTYALSQVRAQKHTMCAPATWKYGPTVRYWRSWTVIVEVTLFRVGCVCRLIFWIALHAHAVTGNCARRCGKFSQTRDTRLYPESYILSILSFQCLSLWYLGDTWFFAWNFLYAKIRGNTNFRQIR